MKYLKDLSIERFFAPVIFLWLLFLPVTFRVLAAQFSSGFDEYEGIFLYANDFFLLLFLVSGFIVALRNRTPFVVSGLFRNQWLILFLLFAAISIFPAPLKILSVYYFARLAAVVFAATLLAAALQRNYIKIKNILAILAGWGVAQSLIALFQFSLQKSIGLKFLGEPYIPGLVHSINEALARTPAGLATINIYGAKLVRAYGTFPHPNILAAFLLLALFSVYYFWFKAGDVRSRAVFSLGISIIMLGLILTFSRSAWFIAFFTTIGLALYMFRIKPKIIALKFITVILVAGLFWTIGLNRLIFPRAQITASEPSASYRLTYNEMALDLIKNNPLGVGLGNQVFYSVKNEVYQKFGMDKLWQWQPVHNIYLLMASEIGILGLVSFLIFTSAFLIFNFKFLILIQNFKLEILISTAMLMALLLFGLVDHFLWTLEPGRLMFWFVIGIMLGVNKPS